MDFWSIFYPVFAAFVASYVVTEALNYGLNYWLYKRQEEARKELESKIASGEIDPMALMLGGGMPSFGGMPVGMTLPTASGAPAETPEIPQHGQYL